MSEAQWLAFATSAEGDFMDSIEAKNKWEGWLAHAPHPRDQKGRAGSLRLLCPTHDQVIGSNAMQPS
jgi:hypothetical protein